LGIHDEDRFVARRRAHLLLTFAQQASHFFGHGPRSGRCRRTLHSGQTR
jgi:hypothetical protein